MRFHFYPDGTVAAVKKHECFLFYLPAAEVTRVVRRLGRVHGNLQKSVRSKQRNEPIQGGDRYEITNQPKHTQKYTQKHTQTQPTQKKEDKKWIRVQRCRRQNTKHETYLRVNATGRQTMPPIKHQT